MRIFIFVCFISLLIIFSAYAVKNEGLVAYYSFNEGNGTDVKDSSGVGNNGVVQGKANWKNGKYGKAFYFDGATYIDLNGKDFKNKPKDAISLCVWVNHEGSGDAQEIFQCIGTGHAQGQYHVEVRTDLTMRWFHRDETNTDVFNVRGFGKVPIGEWTHITGTYNSKTKKAVLYINGVLIKELDGTGADLSTDWNVNATIGEHTKIRWFRGLMDEFYLWQRDLSADEVQQIMNQEMKAVDYQNNISSTWGQIKTKFSL